ncbi:CDP-alcohol phosphatidyltransferase family protein [Poriferisphaera sp. WC338]|uniref:CDP-alcohol phosphatidyltransferase family protein n=1 Tax=Poriferisphaera sp. WC338 TaxID=3425129 RepID=UPI003D816015
MLDKIRMLKKQTQKERPSNIVELDRRPIATREARWSQRIAGWIAQKGVTPNLISIIGMAFGMLAGLMFAASSKGTFGDWIIAEDVTWRVRLLFLGGALFVQMRLLCNMLDGMVAVERGMSSRVGMMLNEVPDRISDIAVLVGLGYAASGNVVIGFWAALVAVMTAYIRAMGKVAGGEKEKQEFVGWMSKSRRMFWVTVLAVWMIVAPDSSQWLWGGMGLVGWFLVLILMGSIGTCIRRWIRIRRRLSELDREEFTQ